MQLSALRVLLLTSLLVPFAHGCEDATVAAFVNAAHHGVRVDGVLPDLGDDEKPRVFTNDLGWTITLSEGFLVTATARFESCDGDGIDIQTPFGPFPEYWSARDKTVTDFGVADLPEGTYCKLLLEYGRYRSEVANMAEDTPFEVQDLVQLEGRTAWLAGYAEKPDGMGGSIVHNFGLETDQTIQVALDTSTIKDGGPFAITGDENATPNLTVLKAYDALFQGVDFDNLDVAGFNKSLPERIRAQTTIIAGTSVY